jgi:hypothetical protein
MEFISLTTGSKTTISVRTVEKYQTISISLLWLTQKRKVDYQLSDNLQVIIVDFKEFKNKINKLRETIAGRCVFLLPQKSELSNAFMKIRSSLMQSPKTINWSPNIVKIRSKLSNEFKCTTTTAICWRITHFQKLEKIWKKMRPNGKLIRLNTC